MFPLELLHKELKAKTGCTGAATKKEICKGVGKGEETMKNDFMLHDVFNSTYQLVSFKLMSDWKIRPYFRNSKMAQGIHLC